MNKYLYLCVSFLMLMSLVGCQTNETIEESVNNRWESIVNGDLEKAYKYFSPGYKEVESLDDFKKRIGRAQLQMKWKYGHFDQAQCDDEEVCSVTVEISYDYSFPRRSLGGVEGVVTKVSESWISVNGAWYYVPKKGM